MTIHHTSEKVTVENYPYGYTLKTTATYAIEHKKGKGFRTVFQTVNPKTGRVNAPKKSTYSPCLLLSTDEDGRVKTIGVDFYGSDGINRSCMFIHKNFDKFTPEQIKDLYGEAYMRLKVDAQALVVYCGADKEKVLEIVKPLLDIAKKGFEEGGNIFDTIQIELDQWDSLRVKDYSPFKVEIKVREANND